MGWWIGLDLLAVEVPVLLVLPVVGALYALLASWQAPGALTASMPLALAAVVAWDGRLDGPDAVHFVTLAVTAIGIGADAVRRADRPAVLVSLATAVATVTYELLSAAGGTGPWAWVGAAGSAALVTAAVVESSEPQRGADVSSSR